MVDDERQRQFLHPVRHRHDDACAWRCSTMCQPMPLMRSMTRSTSVQIGGGAEMRHEIEAHAAHAGVVQLAILRIGEAVVDDGDAAIALADRSAGSRAWRRCRCRGSSPARSPRGRCRAGRAAPAAPPSARPPACRCGSAHREISPPGPNTWQWASQVFGGRVKAGRRRGDVRGSAVIRALLRSIVT